jgi:hypothetical protein
MRTPVAAVVGCCAGIAWLVAIATPAPANAQSLNAGPIVQQAGTAASVSQTKPQEAPAKPAAPQPDNQGAARGPLDQAVNVRFDVTITYQVGSQPPVVRSAALTVADGSTGRLRAGNQVAVPSTTFYQEPKSGGATSPSPGATPSAPLTSYTYRSVGINVDVQRTTVSGNRVKADLGVEFSAVDERRTDSSLPPSFPTFQQNFALVLDSGKPLVVAQSSDQVDKVERIQRVEVKATILK